MDLDFDLFDRRDRDRSRRRRDDHDDHRDRDDRRDHHAGARTRRRRDEHDEHDDRDDRGDRARRRPGASERGSRRDRRRPWWDRRSHRHLFSWGLLAGGAVLVALALIALASAFGVWGYVADAYFAAGAAVLPSSWHDAWSALPGVAHVALGLGALFVVVGAAGELLD